MNSESSPSSQVPESQTLKTKFPVVHVFSEGVSSPRTKRVARGKKIQAIKKNDTPPHTPESKNEFLLLLFNKLPC